MNVAVTEQLDFLVQGLSDVHPASKKQTYPFTQEQAHIWLEDSSHWS